MLGERRERHGERAGELGGAGWAVSEPLDHRSPGRIGERLEHEVQWRGRSLRHMPNCCTRRTRTSTPEPSTSEPVRSSLRHDTVRGSPCPGARYATVDACAVSVCSAGSSGRRSFRSRHWPCWRPRGDRAGRGRAGGGGGGSGWTVPAAVHHAEVIAHRVGEPFGFLLLAVAVTVIEVALIVTLMVSAHSDTSTLARDTVFAAVMLTCNAVVGLVVARGGAPRRDRDIQRRRIGDGVGDGADAGDVEPGGCRRHDESTRSARSRPSSWRSPRSHRWCCTCCSCSCRRCAIARSSSNPRHRRWTPR